MADTAFQTQYRQEFIAGFEQGESLMRGTVTTEAVIKGNTAKFLVADTGGAEPVTRGTNGLIPSRTDNLNTYDATLVEWHDKPRRTNFNIFASQGDGRRIMQEGTVKVMNRKIDRDIIAALATATQFAGTTALPAAISTVMWAQTILGNNDVDLEDEDNLFFVATPAFRAYLMQTTEFTSKDYVDVPMWGGRTRRMLRWGGFNWVFNGNLPSKGTSSEVCFAYHRSAIGHAVNSGEMMVSAGYNDEDDYYWARTSIFMGSKLLQNAGVVKIRHDGSGFAATA